VLPPTINQDDPDPFCDLDYIPNVARYLDSTHPLRFALTHCSGFGGINTALLFARHTAGQLGQEAERSQPEHIAQTMLPQAGPYFLRHMAQVPRRVVITGLGTIAPNGLHTQAFWEHWRAGTPMLDPSDSSHLARMHAAGRVLDLPLEALLDNNTFAFGADEGTASGSSTRAEWKKLLQRTDRMTHFTLAATQEALRDAALVAAEERSRRVGAVIANTFGGGGYVLKQMESFYQRGPRFVSAYTAIAWLHVANVGQLSIRHRLQGYCKTPVNDLAGGLNALGLAYQAIRRGVADVLITGGSEAPLHPYLLHLFDRTALADKRAEDDVYRPFDRRASGLTIAEGAGICILEEYEHALHRNAHIYGEITGYAQANGFTSTALPFQPSSEIYARVLRDSLAQAGVTADDLACVYLDGRAVPSWDHSETAALREVFGPAFETLACSVPRTQIGHSLAAAGVFDAIGALLALHEGIIPPTMHIAQPDPLLCPPGLVRDRARQQRAGSRAALLCGRSLGGSHAALVLQTTAR
jgi:3-oxoacyl-(acyl-carrier-protein) synthase